ncbi:hypothetical protein Psal006b_01361 [Piscirickettsia salmonis]|uniref:Uncharacterized protein n=1 Tax=Piscirickettsia salmonis TaxID=1238 RepID=A0AAC8ZPC7_PISSA|nr:hypothetical protein [Piscirickettsia salmonis]ALB23027.1 hypothetical protein KU39_1847 [Piscirickettsia salmonis]QGN98371.1 hypothetical protein Psal006b_01361 [Piscirickettsia salmonis]QGO01991.1 hypothetical protein Psal008_01375 [Piscirickettsia salmonis]QGO12678.1 hypothetical protein Psal010b_01358 [Piscirickettsia salmonis]QGO19721.1 hypothetical protein Psal013_01371 [Piscirickettsia salmonis]
MNMNSLLSVALHVTEGEINKNTRDAQLLEWFDLQGMKWHF